jgi:hypothetical protein
MKLTHSFPALDAASYLALEAVLLDQFEYPSLPAAYKEFLHQQNGGFVEPGYGSGEVKPSHEVVFDTPLRWVRAEDKPVTPSLISFFGAWLPTHMNKADISNWDLPELIASNEHSKHDFDVLPDRMMSIAKCSHPQAADMLCLGLDPRDFGNVYFYYGMVFHPIRAHGDYYDDKRRGILTKYGLQAEGEIDRRTEAGSDALFELGRVEFVKVADSFDAFLSNCRIVER